MNLVAWLVHPSLQLLLRFAFETITLRQISVNVHGRAIACYRELWSATSGSSTTTSLAQTETLSTLCRLGACSHRIRL